MKKQKGIFDDGMLKFFFWLSVVSIAVIGYGGIRLFEWLVGKVFQ